MYVSLQLIKFEELVAFGKRVKKQLAPSAIEALFHVTAVNKVYDPLLGIPVRLKLYTFSSTWKSIS